MFSARHFLLTVVLAISGCVTIGKSAPPPNPGAQTAASVTVSQTLPGSDYLPEQSAVAAGTKYVVVQSVGGNLLLGPILGSLNIAANSRAMANQYRKEVFGIDPTPLASEAMKAAGMPDGGQAAMFVLKPFVFVQRCDDGKFRLSLVFHVQGNSASSPWVGRYTYDLPTAYDMAHFQALSETEIANYRSELATASSALTRLMQKDLAGQLPQTGKHVNFGSLYIMGSKFGGLGFYTKPEEIHFDAQLVEEADTYVVVRINGGMHNTLVGGGLAFGVHQTQRNLLHTLSPAG
jgi:hypothetical protein